MTLAVAIEHQLGEFRLDASFECGSGVTALFGQSGAGKTTVVNAIAGLVRPGKGRISFDGETLFDSGQGVHVPARRRRFGYVFQEGRLFPHLTVRKNLTYSHLFGERQASGELEHIVELLGLADLLERRPARLSGGEKQRVAIGRALLARPRMLLLDEPLASLDAARRDEILRYLELLRDEVAVPIVYVSHSVEEVIRLADTVVLMSAGKAVTTGEVEEVMGRPDLRAAAGGIFEGGTVIDATVTAQDMEHDLATLAFDGGALTVTNLDALIGEPVKVRIRARDVSIALDRPTRISIQNVLPGRVAAVGESRSGIVDVSISAGAVVLRSRITSRAAEQLALRPGLEVYALIKAVSLDRLGGR
jgi:molybdate transport system ATP-binding protein